MRKYSRYTKKLPGKHIACSSAYLAVWNQKPN